MDNTQARTLGNLTAYCIKHQQDIYIRAYVNGRIGRFALSNMPFVVVSKFILRWHKEQTTPKLEPRPDQVG